MVIINGKQCNYIFVGGKNKNSQCPYFVTQKDDSKTRCCQHRLKCNTKTSSEEKHSESEGDKRESTEGVASFDELKEKHFTLKNVHIPSEEEMREMEFEDRYLRETTHNKKESEYRSWKIKRMRKLMVIH